METRSLRGAFHRNAFPTARLRHYSSFRQCRANTQHWSPGLTASAITYACGDKTVKPEHDVPGMAGFLNSLKWDSRNLVTVIVQVSCQLLARIMRRKLPLICVRRRALQHIDTGEVLMQAYADRAAMSETLQTG